MRAFFWIPVGVAMLGSNVAASATAALTYSAYPDASNNFAEASFTCVLPQGEPKAILFLAGGTDSDARSWLRDRRWQYLAAKEHFVLVAACLRGAGEDYVAAAGGTGQALLDAIESFARQSGRPKLTQLPLILYGHSAGAQFAFNFASWQPARVRAIVCVKSGPLPMPQIRQTPPFHALFIVGEQDQPGRVREVARAFAAGRELGAPWCLALQPDAGHGSNGCRELSDAFLQAVNSSPPGTPTFAKLAHPLNTATSSEARTDPTYAWLPSSSFAKTWRAFVGPVALRNLTNLPDQPPEPRIVWTPITPLPERVDGAEDRIPFTYAISAPGIGQPILSASATANDPEVIAEAKRDAHGAWFVSGEIDVRGRPLGPLKTQIEAHLFTEGDHRVRSEFNLFTRIVGPVSIFPRSLYYGVVPRQRTVELHLDIRSGQGTPIRFCTATSSAPEFLSATCIPSDEPGRYTARCVLKSGQRVGARNGRLTFKIETDHTYRITVPFYGFVKK